MLQVIRNIFPLLAATVNKRVLKFIFQVEGDFPIWNVQLNQQELVLLS